MHNLTIFMIVALHLLKCAELHAAAAVEALRKNLKLVGERVVWWL
jgi:hypothetical protein